MFYNDHAPPHVHVDAGGDLQVVVSILAPAIQPRIMPKATRRAILEWIEAHQEELLANWAGAGVPLEEVEFP